MKALLFLLATSAWAIEPGFEALFDGKTLDGWKHGGNWAVVNGEIARVKKGGSLIETSSAPKTPSAALCFARSPSFETSLGG